MIPELRLPSPIYPVQGLDNQFEWWVKRDDLIHKILSGNKYRKLKRILETVSKMGGKGIISFGGAYSNHLHALAYVCHHLQIECVCIIRGEEVRNQTISDLRSWDAKLHFVSRADYSIKEKSDSIRNLIYDKYPDFLLIPEGGNMDLALTGTSEIIDELAEQIDFVPDYILCAAGTGTTAAGIWQGIMAHGWHSKLCVFSALKGDFLKSDIERKCPGIWDSHAFFIDRFHYGGFAKLTSELKQEIDDIAKMINVPLDYVYNGKLIRGVKELMDQNFFHKGARIVWIHTGGLQGNKGFDQK